MRLLALILIAVGLIGSVTGVGLVLMSQAGQVETVRDWVLREEKSPGERLFKLSFPERERDFIVQEGVTTVSLLLGPAHLSRSARPGQKGNCILTGHRDTHFRILKDLKAGEAITVRDRSGVYHYRVVEFHIVKPDDSRLYRDSQKAVLTLVTCYPFSYAGVAPKRYVVRAELLPG